MWAHRGPAGGTPAILRRGRKASCGRLDVTMIFIFQQRYKNALTERIAQELEFTTLRQVGRYFALGGLWAPVTRSPSDGCRLGGSRLQPARLLRQITSSRTFPLEKLILPGDSIMLWWISHCRDLWILCSPHPLLLNLLRRECRTKTKNKSAFFFFLATAVTTTKRQKSLRNNLDS